MTYQFRQNQLEISWKIFQCSFILTDLIDETNENSKPEKLFKYLANSFESFSRGLIYYKDYLELHKLNYNLLPFFDVGILSLFLCTLSLLDCILVHLSKFTVLCDKVKSSLVYQELFHINYYCSEKPVWNSY